MYDSKDAIGLVADVEGLSTGAKSFMRRSQDATKRVYEHCIQTHTLCSAVYDCCLGIRDNCLSEGAIEYCL